MSDLEGLTNRLLDKGETTEQIRKRLVKEYKTYKNISTEKAELFADAVINEVLNSRKKPADQLIRKILDYPKTNVSMNELGVGCRGKGDFYLHRQIGEMIYSKGSVIGPGDQDDAGAVESRKGEYIICAVDGTHSRLSDYPFIAGFHVTRAALRDVYVKGGRPVALIDDLHLGDDGDVGRLIDFLAGVSCVAELSKVPLIAGSTLRIGGDMVIGDRMVSSVAAVGVSETVKARADVEEGDKILLTEGAGGGTIATLGIYSGNHEIIKETLNLDFNTACKALFDSGLDEKIHAMLDVTNGGLRGDAHEVCASTGLGLVFNEEKTKRMVNKKVLELLEEEGVDYLGVSLDSLLIFCPQDLCDDVQRVVRDVGVEIEVVGKVVKEPAKAVLEKKDGKREEMNPLYRESAYTEIKKIIGEETPEDEERYRKTVEKSIKQAKEKIREVKEYINSKEV